MPSSILKGKGFLIWVVLVLFTSLNVVTIFHAYRFTHFNPSVFKKTGNPKDLSFSKKVSTLLFGVANPRPRGFKKPKIPFETIMVKGKYQIECWKISTVKPKGTVILFHGYGGEKSGMLDKAYIFKALGYNTLLVDFMGAGGSEGNNTTIGHDEGQQVKQCMDYLASAGEKKIFLMGTSMGAAAIMKAISSYGAKPEAIILECPFGSLYKSVCARFNSMKVPSIPSAGLLVFWGGIINGFWALDHNPQDYARDISCPTLLMYGLKDESVSLAETQLIFQRLKGRKELVLFKNAGHENYLNTYRREWTKEIRQFLTTCS